MRMQTSNQGWHSLLTPREWEVARLVARGLSNKEIAQMLGTSPGTVKLQVHWVLQKLGVSKRGDLVLRRRA
jgi:DNA-binding NarL/FixJ family response regulator